MQTLSLQLKSLNSGAGIPPRHPIWTQAAQIGCFLLRIGLSDFEGYSLRDFDGAVMIIADKIIAVGEKCNHKITLGRRWGNNHSHERNVATDSALFVTSAQGGHSWFRRIHDSLHGWLLGYLNSFGGTFNLVDLYVVSDSSNDIEEPRTHKCFTSQMSQIL